MNQDLYIESMTGLYEVASHVFALLHSYTTVLIYVYTEPRALF